MLSDPTRRAFRERLALRRGPLRLLWVLAALLGLQGAAWAQPVADSSAQRVRPQPLGLASGYQQQVHRYHQLRRKVTDTSAAYTDDIDPRVRIEIDGLIVDETQTKVGRDFYDAFYGLWQAPAGAFNFTVTITERPSPGRGTIILIRVNDEVAFQSQLQPKYDVIQSTVRQAVYYVHRKLRASSASPVSR